MSENVKKMLHKESLRGKPDYIVYVPGHYDGSTNDSVNVHFLAFDGPDDSLMAVWTQSAKGGPWVGGTWNNRIVFSRSEDEGHTWTAPLRIAGVADENHPTHMASWGFPLVAKSGRIYVIWNQNQGGKGWILMHTGAMAGCYSDDNGKT